jgi:hypothetical protein
MKGLDSYKLDKAFTDGVVIFLDDAPEVAFKVKLPSPYNRGYSQALYGAMDFKIDEEGKAQAAGNMMEARYAQEDAFIEFCIISVEMVDDGESLDKQEFASGYPEGLAELMNKATELADSITEKVTTSVKKSSASSSGSETGQVRSASTLSLKAGAK